MGGPAIAGIHFQLSSHNRWPMIAGWVLDGPAIAGDQSFKGFVNLARFLLIPITSYEVRNTIRSGPHTPFHPLLIWRQKVHVICLL